MGTRGPFLTVLLLLPGLLLASAAVDTTVQTQEDLDARLQEGFYVIGVRSRA